VLLFIHVSQDNLTSSGFCLIVVFFAKYCVYDADVIVTFLAIFGLLVMPFS